MIRARTILANVRVLAIGQNVEEQNGKKVVTGAPTRRWSLIPRRPNSSLLAQHTGDANMHLVLRSLVDSGGPTKTVATFNEEKAAA